MTALNQKNRPTAKRPVPASVKSSRVEKLLDQYIGRPWAEVLSEIERTFPGIGLAQVLKGCPVATRTVLKEGKVRVPRQGDTPLALEEASELYYVDPTHKTLCRNEPRLRHLDALQKMRLKQAQQASAMRKELSDTLIALRKGDAWYVVELAPLSGVAFDIFLRRSVGQMDERELKNQYGKPKVYAMAMRELTYRERHQLGLAV